ncbi:hypothetical protein G5I_03689 [Acromyrmex echinatior]|uniref:Uncharacterized protein n=1 Tax=Acromyrmex echinatior TaxID=103372 RepID=F4WDN5_ACREC|nr:hypothetical protein G5I_03689 [Acromyrmex echinatior]
MTLTWGQNIGIHILVWLDSRESEERDIEKVAESIDRRRIHWKTRFSGIFECRPTVCAGVSIRRHRQYVETLTPRERGRGSHLRNVDPTFSPLPSEKILKGPFHEGGVQLCFRRFMAIYGFSGGVCVEIASHLETH